MPVFSRVEISEDRLRAALTGPDGDVTRYVLRVTRNIRNRAVLYCPVDTGNLRASIATGAVRTEGSSVVGTVGTPVEYAAAVHEGVRAQTVTVAEHTVRAHEIKAHTVAARTQQSFTVPGKGGRPAYTVAAHTIREHQVYARTQLGHTVPAHTRAIKARAGRPFLRQAMEDVLGEG